MNFNLVVTTQLLRVLAYLSLTSLLSIVLSIFTTSLISYGATKPATTPRWQTIHEVDSYRVTRSTDTLRVRLTHWPQIFHPYKKFNPASELINTLLHSSLLYFDQRTGTYHPYLAKSYHYSSNYKTLTFKLRTIARTLGDKPVDAYDVEFSLNSLIAKPCTDCELMAARLHNIKNIKVLAPHTIQIMFHQGNQYHHRTIGQLPIISRAQDPNTPITQGSGSYQLQLKGPMRVEYGKSIIFTRKSQPWMKQLDFFKDLFEFPTIEGVYLHNDELAVAAFTKGLLTTLAFPHNLLDHWFQLKNQPNPSTQISYLAYPQHHLISYQFMVWNPKHAETQDPLLREALYHLFPEPSFHHSITQHHNKTLIDHPFTRDLSVKQPQRSAQTAAALVRKLLKLNKTDKIPPNSIEVSLQYSDLDGSTWLTQYQTNAQAVGIKLNLVYRSLREMQTLVASQKYDGVLLTHTLKHSEDIYELLHSTGIHNYWGLDNPKLDDDLEQLMVTTDSSAQLKLEHQIASLLAKSHTLMYLSRTNHHHIAYHPTKLKALQPMVYPYSGSDQQALYYLHWQPPSS